MDNKKQLAVKLRISSLKFIGLWNVWTDQDVLLVEANQLIAYHNSVDIIRTISIYVGRLSLNVMNFCIRHHEWTRRRNCAPGRAPSRCFGSIVMQMPSQVLGSRPGRGGSSNPVVSRAASVCHAVLPTSKWSFLHIMWNYV